MAYAVAVCQHYGVTIVDYIVELQRLVNNEGATLADYYADNIHPTVAGQQVIAGLLEPVLLNSSGGKPAVMPGYYAATAADYENPSTRLLGTAYDSRSGTWSDVGSSARSSEVGAIITYSATCQSYGCFRADFGSVTNDVQISMDGGAFEDKVFNHNGTPIAGGRGLHTIAVKVKSGTVRIDEFWTI